MHTLPDIIIETRDLRRVFKMKEAVAGISFSVRRGEIFGLLGPNGAGKTTTIRMLTGQIDPSGGSATVAGCDVVKDRAQLKERIGVVFEEQNLYERLSARNNLEFSRWLYGLPKSRVDEVLELVHLRDRAKERVSTFSNGMKQRMMIARALLHRPPMLFLDEPSRGLDPISAREVREAVKQLSDEGITILLTTHLMDEADQLCQQVAFIVNGKLVANDAPRNLKLEHGQRELAVTLQGSSLDSSRDMAGQSAMGVINRPLHAPWGEASGDGSDSFARRQDQSALKVGYYPWREVTIKLDDPGDQKRLEEWMAEGKVLAIHSREATLEEVFIEIAGIRSA